METETQVDNLEGLACKFGQGYYFSRPLPLAALHASRLSSATATDREMIAAPETQET